MLAAWRSVFLLFGFSAVAMRQMRKVRLLLYQLPKKERLRLTLDSEVWRFSADQTAYHVVLVRHPAQKVEQLIVRLGVRSQFLGELVDSPGEYQVADRYQVEDDGQTD